MGMGPYDSFFGLMGDAQFIVSAGMAGMTVTVGAFWCYQDVASGWYTSTSAAGIGASEALGPITTDNPAFGWRWAAWVGPGPIEGATGFWLGPCVSTEVFIAENNMGFTRGLSAFGGSWNMTCRISIPGSEVVSIQEWTKGAKNPDSDAGDNSYFYESNWQQTGMGETTGQFGFMPFVRTVQASASPDGCLHRYSDYTITIGGNSQTASIDWGSEVGGTWVAVMPQPLPDPQITMTGEAVQGPGPNPNVPATTWVSQSFSAGSVSYNLLDGLTRTASVSMTNGYNETFTASGQSLSVNSNGHGIRAQIIWNAAPCSYSYSGSVVDMDGNDLTSSAIFTNEMLVATARGEIADWNGTTSPTYNRLGDFVITFWPCWQDEAESDSATTSASPTTSASGYSTGGTYYSSAALCNWTLQEGPPTLQMILKNPEAFNAATDDRRVQMLYPRQSNIASCGVNSSATIDPMTDATKWVGVNCTVTAISGGISVTNVQTGAYIHRTDFTKHWPLLRFADLSGKITKVSDDTAGTFGCKLVARETFSHTKGSVGSDGSFTMRFDTCFPDGASGIDTIQSYMCDPVTNVGALPYNPTEGSPAGWSMGIGKFAEVRITSLTVGQNYTFTGLSGVLETELGATAPSLEIWREAVPSGGGDGYIPLGIDGESPPRTFSCDRGAILLLNGKYGQEYACRFRTKYDSPSAGEIIIDSTETIESTLVSGAAAWPADDYGVLNCSAISAMRASFPPDSNDGTYPEGWLFAPDNMPLWFAIPGSYTETATIPGKPVFDKLQAPIWWGDGSSLGNHITAYFRKVVRGKLTGMLAADNLDLPDMNGKGSYSVGVDSTRTSMTSAVSDIVGWVRTSDEQDTANIYAENSYSGLTPIRNSAWFRFGTFVQIANARIIGACNSTRTGRTYVSFIDSAGAVQLRIYDQHHTTYVDRPMSGISVQSNGSIAMIESRLDCVKIIRPATTMSMQSPQPTRGRLGAHR
jgi:hypothetical protein